MSNSNNAYEVDEQALDLVALIRILRKRFLLIILITLIAAGAAYVYSYYFMKPTYYAKTVLLVPQATDTVGKSQTSTKTDLSSVIYTATHAPVLTMSTYVGEIKSEAMMQRVIEKLRLDTMGYLPRSLAGRVNATAAKDSYLIEVTVSNATPDLAVSIANTLGQEFIAMMRERNQALMDQAIISFKEQMELVRSDLARTTDPGERARLEGVLRQISEGVTQAQITRNTDGSANMVVTSPALLAYPVMPNRLYIMAAAMILGLMVSLGLAYLLELADSSSKRRRRHVGGDSV